MLRPGKPFAVLPELRLIRELVLGVIGRKFN